MVSALTLQRRVFGITPSPVVLWAIDYIAAATAAAVTKIRMAWSSAADFLRSKGSEEYPAAAMV
jgi:hypothetical protein